MSEMTDKQKNLLIHSVLNEIEEDFNDQYYESLDELLTKLLNLPDAKDLFENYLSEDRYQKMINEDVEKRY